MRAFHVLIGLQVLLGELKHALQVALDQYIIVDLIGIHMLHLANLLVEANQLIEADDLHLAGTGMI